MSQGFPCGRALCRAGLATRVAPSVGSLRAAWRLHQMTPSKLLRSRLLGWVPHAFGCAAGQNPAPSEHLGAGKECSQRQRPAPGNWRKHTAPDWTQIHRDLQKHKDLTPQLIWQELRESNPEGYAYRL